MEANAQTNIKPDCVIRYEQLKLEYEKVLQEMDNKKVSLQMLDSLLKVITDEVKIHGADYIPSSNKDLCEKAGYHQNAFGRNFKSQDSIIITTKATLIKGADEYIEQNCFPKNTATMVKALMEFLALRDPNDYSKNNRRRSEIAILSFHVEFWEMLLMPFFDSYRGEIKDWDSLDMSVKNCLHTCFASQFQTVMLTWYKSGFKEKDLNHFFELLTQLRQGLIDHRYSLIPLLEEINKL